MSDLHPEIQAELTALVDGALEPAAAARVETHLAGCPACRERAGRIRAALAALATLPAPAVSPGFEQRFHARLAQERTARRGLSALLSWRFLAPLAAAGAAAAVVVVVNAGDRREQLGIAARLELLESYELVASLGDVSDDDADLVAHLDELGGRP